MSKADTPHGNVSRPVSPVEMIRDNDVGLKLVEFRVQLADLVRQYKLLKFSEGVRQNPAFDSMFGDRPKQPSEAEKKINVARGKIVELIKGFSARLQPAHATMLYNSIELVFFSFESGVPMEDLRLILYECGLSMPRPTIPR